MRKSKDTESVRLFEEFLRDRVSVDDIAADFAQLSPYQRLAMLEKFASYVWPKMKSIEMEVAHEERSPAMLSLIRHLSSLPSPSTGSDQSDLSDLSDQSDFSDLSDFPDFSDFSDFSE